MRPEFTIELKIDGQSVLERIRDSLDQEGTGLQGQVIAGHAMISLPAGRRSFLSPVLNLEAVEHDGRHQMRGRFSPQPNVWTGFMAVHGVLALFGLAGLIYGLAQLTVEGMPWAMLVAPAALSLMGFVYGAAFIGQGLTVDDMYEMRAFVEEMVGDQPLRSGGVSASGG